MALPKLSLEQFVSIPRRSALFPNSEGTYALFTQSNYAGSSDANSLHVINLETLESKLVSKTQTIQNPKWEGRGAQVIWTTSVDRRTEIWIGDMENNLEGHYKAADLAASFTLLETCIRSGNTLGLLFHGTYPSHGDEASNQDTKQSSMKEYTSLPILTSDGYIQEPGPTLWYAELQKSFEGHYSLSPTGILGVLPHGNDLEFDPYPHNLAFPSIGCALSPDIIVYSARSRASAPATWSSVLYRVAISSLSTTNSSHKPMIAPSHTGQCSLPVFSPSGSTIAFTKSHSGKNPFGSSTIYVVNINGDDAREVALETHDGGRIDIEIESLLWSQDEKSLFICSTSHGRRALVKVDIQGASAVPETLIDSGISSVHRLPNHRLLCSLSSFTCPSEYAIYNLKSLEKRCVAQITLDKYGVGEHQVSEFCCTGADDNAVDVQTWILRPSFYQEGHRYPLAMLIYGGPTWAFTNTWQPLEVGWNALLLAEQGYVVALPNTRGSPGISSAFKASILTNPGSSSCIDISHCLQYMTSNLAYVDTTRTIALGFSYGGYLLFYLASHHPQLSTHFKAMIVHAGTFSNPGLAASDVPDLMGVLFGGPQSSNSNPPSSSASPPSNAKGFNLIHAFNHGDPSSPTSHNWKTPMLISVGEQDRRVPCTQGMGAFAALQCAGVESRLLVFPDEGHLIVKPGNKLRWYEETVGWMEKFVG